MIVSAAAAFCATLLLVPLIRRYCERHQLFDRPGPLKIHARPIPRLGGIGVFVGVLVGTFAVSTTRTEAATFDIGLSVVWCVGVIDDLRGLNPLIRLLAQFTAAALLWYAGWRFPFVSGSAASLIGVCLFVAFAANSFNFLDGADGLATGVTIIIATAYLFLPRSALSSVGVAIAASLAGACCAFLFSNFPPANMFLGDGGSTTLGFVVAFLSLDFYRVHAAAGNVIAFPLVAASLPLVDAFIVISRRITRKRSPFFADRSHGYDRLMMRGFSARSVALIFYAMAAACCFIASATISEGSAQSRAVLVSVGVLFIAAGVVFVRRQNPPQTSARLPASR